MRTQAIDWVKRRNQRAGLLWFGLGFTLVLGILVVTLGILLLGAQGGSTGNAEAEGEDAARALMLQRFGEWRQYETPFGAPTEGWQQYRAGEHVPQPEARAAVPQGWEAYRSVERASLNQAVPLPQGWADYRAGERAPR